MFFILSKLLVYLIMPFTLIALTFLSAFFIKNLKWKKIMMVTGLGLIFFFGNDFIINEIFLAWEEEPVPFNKMKDSYDVAIILGGVSSTTLEPSDRVYYNKGADRVIHTLHLFKRGIIKNILISGGTGRLLQNTPKEADNLKKTLVLFGVPESNIFIDNQSKNTYENAVYSAEILNKEFPEGKFLLVTSAFHLPRAKACFDKIGIKSTSFSTDFYGHPREFTPDIMIIPSLPALTKWSIIIREWVGIVAYKIAGYI